MDDTESPLPDTTAAAHADDAMVTQELDRLHDTYGPNSPEVAAYIAHIGLTLNNASAAPLLDLSKERTDDLLHMLIVDTKQQLARKKDITHLADSFVGFMKHKRYSDTDLYKQINDQTAVLADLATAFLGTTPRDALQRADRIAHMDMLTCAADYVTNKRNNFFSPKTRYKPWGHNIVTDDNNSLYKPHKTTDLAVPYQTVAQCHEQQIQFTMYENFDATENFILAVDYLTHEFAHVTSERWEENELKSEIYDHNELSIEQRRIRKLFEDNADSIGSKESKAAAHSVYYNQEEERMANHAQDHGFSKVVAESEQNVDYKTYMAELSDNPVFAPLVASLELYGKTIHYMNKIAAFAAMFNVDNDELQKRLIAAKTSPGQNQIL